ncbi:MAG TPA: RDD family protein [Chloroflexota bacterium]|nr:RDD family protein [Chloroflexota bacterium]
MVPDYAVLTPERISLQYDVAGIGSRSAAALIDVTILLAVLLVLGLAFALLARLTGVTAASFEEPDAAMLPMIILGALAVVAVFVVLFGYFMFFEIVWSGQTPGKRVLGIRVLRENGYPVRPGDSVVRNLIRVIDGPPFGAVVGLTVMLLNSRSRRLGDFGAGTIVVREGTRRGVAALTAPPAADAQAGPPGSPGAPVVPVLSPADATLLRDFLVRRERLDAESRGTLARRLADTLAKRYGLQAQRSGSSDEVFLERLAGR